MNTITTIMGMATDTTMGIIMGTGIPTGTGTGMDTITTPIHRRRRLRPLRWPSG